MIATSTEWTEKYGFLRARDSLDWPAVECPQTELMEFLRSLKDEEGFDFLADVTAIDHYDADPRYEVVYHLFSTTEHVYLRVVTPCAGGAQPQCLSLVPLWPTADWHERETYDMFGIRFSGHPDLRRILMWDGYPYHPLRKEFPLAGIEVELPSPDTTEATGGATAKPAPMMGGPFHSPQHGTMARREPRADDESWTEVRERADNGEAAAPRDLRPQE